MATSAPPVPEPDRPGYAIILAGGSGRRLGSVDKPGLLVGRSSLLDRALAAVMPARTVVVGPRRDLPGEVLQTSEEPPGGGPAAALVAGLARLSGLARLTGSVGRSNGFDDSDLVTVLAADLPGIDARAVDLLAAAVTGQTDGAVLVDPGGRTQYLAGVWRTTVLMTAAASRPSWHGVRVSELLRSINTAGVPADRVTTADIDTPADLLEWGVVRPEPE